MSAPPASMKLRWYVLAALATPASLLALWLLLIAVDWHRARVARAYHIACDNALVAEGYDPTNPRVIVGPVGDRICLPIWVRMGVEQEVAGACVTMAADLLPRDAAGEPHLWWRQIAIPACQAVFPSWGYWDR